MREVPAIDAIFPAAIRGSHNHRIEDREIYSHPSGSGLETQHAGRKTHDRTGRDAADKAERNKQKDDEFGPGSNHQPRCKQHEAAEHYGSMPAGSIGESVPHKRMADAA